MLRPGFGMIALDDLQLFLAVARERSFVAAARRLGLPTSTLSRRFAGFEERLGVRLVQRTSRRVGLTVEGHRLLEAAGPPFEALTEAVAGATDHDREPAGRLRVTAPVLTGAGRIAPALYRFAADFPRVTLELDLTNQLVPLVADGYDLAFRVGPIRDAELVARRLWSLPQAFAASRELVRARLGGQTRITVATLLSLPAVLTRAGGWRLVRKGGAVEPLEPRARVVVNDPRVAIAAAVAGLGVVCTAEEALAAHGRELVTLTIIGRRIEPRDLYAVYPTRTLVPARVRAALAYVLAGP